MGDVFGRPFVLWPGVLDMLAQPENSMDEFSVGLQSGEQTIFKKMTRIDWLGQTIASSCWIVSVFAYGLSSTGDWLQLTAASSWMIANLASLFKQD